MTNKEAIDVLQDVRAYLTSLESAVVNEGLASHSYVEICQAITRITSTTQGIHDAIAEIENVTDFCECAPNGKCILSTSTRQKVSHRKEGDIFGI